MTFKMDYCTFVSTACMFSASGKEMKNMLLGIVLRHCKDVVWNSNTDLVTGLVSISLSVSISEVTNLFELPHGYAVIRRATSYQNSPEITCFLSFDIYILLLLMIIIVHPYECTSHFNFLQLSANTLCIN